jgi:hypothetical protein
MPGNLPTTPKFQTLNMTNINNTLSTQSDDGRMVRRTTGVQYWKFTAAYPVGRRSDYGALMGFIASQQGEFGSFTATLPEYSTTQGSLVQATNTLLINNAGGYAVGSKTLNVDVSPGINITGALKAGDYINFGFHNKVYMLTADLDIDGSGEGLLKIEPGLVATVADDETVVYGDVQFTVRLAGDVQEFSAGLGDTVRYEIDLVEDI